MASCRITAVGIQRQGFFFCLVFFLKDSDSCARESAGCLMRASRGNGVLGFCFLLKALVSRGGKKLGIGKFECERLRCPVYRRKRISNMCLTTTDLAERMRSRYYRCVSLESAKHSTPPPALSGGTAAFQAAPEGVCEKNWMSLRLPLVGK